MASSPVQLDMSTLQKDAPQGAPVSLDMGTLQHDTQTPVGSAWQRIGDAAQGMADSAADYAEQFGQRVQSNLQGLGDTLDELAQHPEEIGNALSLSTPHSATSLKKNVAAALPSPAAYTSRKGLLVNLPADIATGAVFDEGTGNQASTTAREMASDAASVADEPRANFATSRITKLIKPMAGDLKYGAEPAAALPKEGITGSTLDELGEKVYARARDVGKTIDAVLQSPENAKKTVDISPAVNRPIEEAEKAAVRAGDSALYDKLQTLRKQVTNVWKVVTDEKGNKSLQPSAPRNLQMTPMEAVQLKRDIADMTRWTGDPMDNEVNAVKARVFGGIKDTVNQAVPDVTELNKRYADLVNAGKAIERRAPVAARSADFSLGDLGTLAVGDALTGSPGVGIAAEVARRAARHPGIMSRVAAAAMPENMKYEEPAAIRARLKQGPPETPVPAPKGAPEGGKPPQPERRGGTRPPNAPVFTNAERAKFQEEMDRIEAARHPNPHLKENPFDRHPSHKESLNSPHAKADFQAALDVLNGRKRGIR